MRRPRDFAYAYPRVVKYLGIRPRSVKEIREYLEKKNIELEVIERVIQQLLKDKFLNDKEFAVWWTRGRQSKGKAIFIIRRELEEKGVDRDIVEEVTGECAKDDTRVAQEVVDKYHPRYAKYSGREYFEKMGAFLARRGFSYEIIRKVLNS